METDHIKIKKELLRFNKHVFTKIKILRLSNFFKEKSLKIPITLKRFFIMVTNLKRYITYPCLVFILYSIK